MSPLALYEIVGIAITAGTGIVTYLRSASEAKAQNAAMVSITGVIFTTLMGIRFDLIPKIVDHLKPAEVIRSDPKRKALLERVANLGSAVSPANPLMASVLKIRMESLREHFDQMENGKFSVDDAEMPLFNLQMIQSARKVIGATNYGSTWWQDPLGDRYEEANEKAVKRGVAVSRVFIFEKPEEMESAKKIMTQEARSGIKVRFALLKDLRMLLTANVIVIDGALAGEHTIIPEKGFSNAQFFVNPSDIERVRHELESIEASAQDFKF